MFCMCCIYLVHRVFGFDFEVNDGSVYMHDFFKSLSRAPRALESSHLYGRKHLNE